MQQDATSRNAVPSPRRGLNKAIRDVSIIGAAAIMLTDPASAWIVSGTPPVCRRRN
jgi:hypothetical protein